LCDLAPSRGYLIECMHVNHGLSQRADAWAEFCAQLCHSRNVKFTTVRVDLADVSRSGLEASARIARYDALLRDAPEFVLVAHHLNDQAETVLMQLLRGSGVKGLSAMAEPRPGRSGRLLRPMLGESYSEICDYAEARGLSWVTDDSNEDTRFSRNFVRHELFPLLEGRFPGAIRAMARSASHLAEAQSLMDDLAAVDISPIRSCDGLDLTKLKALDDVRAKNVVRFYFGQCGFDLPQSAHIGELMRQIRSMRYDSRMQVRLGGVVARSHRGRLLFERPRPGPASCREYHWAGESSWALPEFGGVFKVNRNVGQGISEKKLQAAPVFARLRKGGERLRFDALRPTRTLKNLFREAEVPYWKRSYLPLVYCGEQLVFVPGLGVSFDYRAEADECGVVMEWSENRSAD
jgi:tRNA(Ile)-lysidine synthase